MDDKVEGQRVSGDTVAEVRSSTQMFLATFEEKKQKLSCMFIPHRSELRVTVRGGPIVAASVCIDKDAAIALTRWLQQRIAEM